MHYEADSFIWPCRAMAPGLLDSKILGLQTLEHVLRVSRTWDSIVSLLPKGGETIWGNLDWSPEEGHACQLVKKGNFQCSPNDNYTDAKRGFQIKETEKYGRIISFGKEESQLPSSQIPSLDSKVLYFYYYFSHNQPQLIGFRTWDLVEPNFYLSSEPTHAVKGCSCLVMNCVSNRNC